VVQHRAIHTIADQQEVVWSIKRRQEFFTDLERPQTQISRSRHCLTLNISETIQDTDIVTMEQEWPWVTWRNVRWHKASRGLSATAELLALKYNELRTGPVWPVCRGFRNWLARTVSNWYYLCTAGYSMYSLWFRLGDPCVVI